MKRVRVSFANQFGVFDGLHQNQLAKRRVNGAAFDDLPQHALPANLDHEPHAIPGAGLLSSTRVQTPNGPRMLSELRIGDVVLDHTRSATRVTAISKAPKVANGLCIRAPYFGLDQDLFIGAKQALLLSGERVEDVFGSENILMPAWALRDKSRVTFREFGPSDQLLEVKLENGNALRVGNCAVAPKPVVGSDGPALDLTDSEARCFAAMMGPGYSNAPV